MSDLGAYHRCLSSRQRRVLLYELRDRELTTIDELASTLVTECYAQTGSGAASRREAAMDLRHSHLPMLEELAVVEYDARTGTVRVHEVPPGLEALLDVSERFERRP